MCTVQGMVWGWEREMTGFDARVAETMKTPVRNSFRTENKMSVADKVDENPLVCYGWEVTKAFSEGQSTTYGGLLSVNWPCCCCKSWSRGQA